MSRQTLFRTAATAGMLIAVPTLAIAATLFQRTFEPAHRGSSCYHRAYTAAERRHNPDLKIHQIVLRTSATNLSGGSSGSNNFGLKVGVQTGSYSYAGLAGCKPGGPGFVCTLEAGGGSFQLERSGRGLRIATRRMKIDGGLSQLEIKGTRRHPQRSFTLNRGDNSKCDNVLIWG